MYSIGDIARLGGVSARMLRHYDEISLFRPAAVNANGPDPPPNWERELQGDLRSSDSSV